MEMSLFRVPIAGWKKCAYDAAAFESAPEYHAAKILDSDSSVCWWLRNDPVQFRIPTPVGYMEPDFVYLVEIKGLKRMRILEVKGEHLWNGPGSFARIKAAGAAAWAKAVCEAKLDPSWEFHEVLGQDAEASQTLGSMLDKAVIRFETTGGKANG
jgi:Endonuclease domain